ncbi:hypothetical protein C530_045 [Candidatus Portiera aleyrodidarum BT-B-HRs]|uniref:tRNA delta(2)-isopentenylpyrophosphate transferase n=1 Tax=Candidatus Portiera aleyrodidarum TaxID=91844 RepID=UPI00027B304A|nr:tRNA delta(2)-isopentenylpyrophosphate transferase [Candidatus Portiera aleyrodidarum]AFQ24020.1 tRNA delta(2)-isopentenylpyrophosphate transferase [Candidatus Portiera aleyrodidarum BT-B-HRs]AFT80691.1 hypothetical protein C530_045 [Candidatus Portiera aleyrodidarum BT-B-HRs]ASX27175.1 tRNA delta(2)-isopentenylpyrophosphate transferase [Candidatus Portiera aleyrodidarum MED (Bemisia tabaci)]
MDFRKEAIKTISKLGKIHILVCGTMFNLKTLLEGIATITFYNIKLSNKYCLLFNNKLFHKTVLKLYNKDIYRIKRLLEVYLNTD